MSNYEEQIQEIEVGMNEAKEIAKKMEALRRLMDNKDWELIINQDYLRGEPARIVSMKADVTQQESSKQAEYSKMLDSIGYFGRYLSGVLQMGYHARDTLNQLKDTRAEVLSEMQNDGEG